MSTENLEQFMSKVADSEEIQAYIGEKIDAEALILLGTNFCFEFTAEELQDFAVELIARHETEYPDAREEPDDVSYWIKCAYDNRLWLS